ncbi:PTS sugar transporter subunit IIB [Sporolactobacillus sp. KGMB 08714]|uniref:PTS sugar transporter subunit IIB n=1 Tax=Sporolactobacillus sp. KGMB 08714 TaxID=3064704 RepID=UPI002FBDA29E
MAGKTIMLACSAGMSTSMLVSKMKQTAESEGKDYKIFAIATSSVDHSLEAEHPDVLLLGPQVAYMQNEIKKKTDRAGIPLAVISMKDYGMMDGKSVLHFAETLIK